jgi:mannose-6-phosphate isomerase-like protein (cupin superfamily)
MATGTERDFETKKLSPEITELAPDGSNVRLLLALDSAVMAHYELLPNQISKAVTNRTVEEIWYFISGRGEMWRKQRDNEEIVVVEPGVCITIPLATHFQFRTQGSESLEAVGIVIPPWPGPEEAVVVKGKWEPSVL